MYKGASASLQRRHAVGRPHPSNLAVFGREEDEPIPNAGNMSLEECLAEKRQLGVELAKAENELRILKREHRPVADIGHRMQSIIQRRSVINTRIRSFREQDPSECLAEAIRQTVPDEIQAAIFKRAKAISKAKFG